ncbi:MAG: PepSY domain-containing protein [Chakrabartia sp.]
MTVSQKLILLPLALLIATPAFAHGNVQCHSGPKAAWKSVETLKASILAQGWKIKKVKAEKDCYEVYGTTPEGDKVEAFFHPVTLQKILVLRRGQVLYRAPGHQ